MSEPAQQPLTERAQWQALERHRDVIGPQHLRALFAADAHRGERFTAQAAGWYLDYSKQRVNDDTLRVGPA